MTVNDWSIVAGVLGFLGSLMLFYPGWRVSRSLKMIASLRAVINRYANATDKKSPKLQTAQLGTAEKPIDDVDESHDPGPELVEILEEQHAAWRPIEHWLLIGGILLIIMSFAVDLFLVELANQTTTIAPDP